MEFKLYSDGAVKDKIGSFGFVLYAADKEIDRGWGLIGRGPAMNETIAEYYGLSSGLDSFMRHLDSHPVLDIYLDSQHVVRQLNKISRRKESFEFQIVDNKIRQLRNFCKVGINWIPRHLNKTANDLAKVLRNDSSNDSI